MRAALRKSRWLRPLLVTGLSLFVAGSAAEGLILFSLHHPKVLHRLPPRFARAIRELYKHVDRKIIQFEPAFARYDPGLFYTLRPGQFTFANREFRTEYRVNSLGVRDDEDSLHGPDIVVLGDSYAMGWGVEQDETFPKVLGRKLGKKVLNAAVSSYGGSRELMLLDRVDLARAKTLVIQHCGNDFDEEQALTDNEDRLPIRSADEFARIQAEYLHGHRYWWGQYTRLLLFPVKRPEPPEEKPDWHHRAANFLHVLQVATKQKLDNLELVVLDLEDDEAFLTELDRLRREPSYPRFIQRMKIVDVESKLDRVRQGFILDDHLNAAGHALVADELAKVIGR
jgi:lysophospholipase L1-like esterase